MILSRNILPLFLTLICLNSCKITSQISTLQIEIMKPGIFEIPKELTLAVINRNLLRSDTCTFYYYNGYERVKDTVNTYQELFKSGKDTSIKYQNLYEIEDYKISYKDLSDTCVNGLIDYLKGEGYFRKVIKSGDSLNYFLRSPGSITTQDELFEKTKSDVCIFLDFIQFKTTYNPYFSTPFKTKAKLLWNIAFKSDSLVYGYNQADTLFYNQAQVSIYSRYKEKVLGLLLNNSCNYLGKSFGTKVIPSWIQVDRMYYQSRNREMIKAEKYALNQDWLNAAEIWNSQTKSKNKKIVAKASYNMALACEMEGKPDAAIAWLVLSNSALEKNDKGHEANCQRYVNILATRKLEINRLEEEARVPGFSPKTEK